MLLCRDRAGKVFLFPYFLPFLHKISDDKGLLDYNLQATFQTHCQSTVIYKYLPQDRGHHFTNSFSTAQSRNTFPEWDISFYHCCPFKGFIILYTVIIQRCIIPHCSSLYLFLTSPKFLVVGSLAYGRNWPVLTGICISSHAFFLPLSQSSY